IGRQHWLMTGGRQIEDSQATKGHPYPALVAPQTGVIGAATSHQLRQMRNRLPVVGWAIAGWAVMKLQFTTNAAHIVSALPLAG
ncbi:MAG TPA: hypothetical protein PLR07_00530, partial [Promineifilum sp.]|nr:hypothetical protein [Promineifilum sp.]